MEFEGETKMRLTENTELQIKEVSEFKKIKNGTDDERAKTISLKKSVVDKCEFFLIKILYDNNGSFLQLLLLNATMKRSVRIY